MKGRTAFVVAHRLSAIRVVHRIVVLDQGKIIETGTHKSLLAKKGFYYDLYMSQFRREVDEEDTAVTTEEDSSLMPGD